MIRETAEQRFYRKLPADRTPDGCWIWQGATYGPQKDIETRYGRIYVSPSLRHMPAHRFSYELFVGPIPEGLQLDHLCRRRRCVNPAHLEPVTAQENIRRYTRLLTHCKNDHALDGMSNRGWRFCTICAREARRRCEIRRRARAA